MIHWMYEEIHEFLQRSIDGLLQGVIKFLMEINELGICVVVCVVVQVWPQTWF